MLDFRGTAVTWCVAWFTMYGIDLTRRHSTADSERLLLAVSQKVWITPRPRLELIELSGPDSFCWQPPYNFIACCMHRLDNNTSELIPDGVGNKRCWSGDFTYARCCLGVAGTAEVGAVQPLRNFQRTFPPKLAAYESGSCDPGLKPYVFVGSAGVTPSREAALELLFSPTRQTIVLPFQLTSYTRDRIRPLIFGDGLEISGDGSFLTLFYAACVSESQWVSAATDFATMLKPLWANITAGMLDVMIKGVLQEERDLSDPSQHQAVGALIGNIWAVHAQLIAGNMTHQLQPLQASKPICAGVGWVLSCNVHRVDFLCLLAACLCLIPGFLGFRRAVSALKESVPQRSAWSDGWRVVLSVCVLEAHQWRSEFLMPWNWGLGNTANFLALSLSAAYQPSSVSNPASLVGHRLVRQLPSRMFIVLLYLLVFRPLFTVELMHPSRALAFKSATVFSNDVNQALGYWKRSGLGIISEVFMPFWLPLKDVRTISLPFFTLETTIWTAVVVCRCCGGILGGILCGCIITLALTWIRGGTMHTLADVSSLTLAGCWIGYFGGSYLRKACGHNAHRMGVVSIAISCGLHARLSSNLPVATKVPMSASRETYILYVICYALCIAGFCAVVRIDTSWTLLPSQALNMIRGLGFLSFGVCLTHSPIMMLMWTGIDFDPNKAVQEGGTHMAFSRGLLWTTSSVPGAPLLPLYGCSLCAAFFLYIFVQHPCEEFVQWLGWTINSICCSDTPCW